MGGLPYLALMGMCHLIGYSFQSQCSVLNRWLSKEPGTYNITEQFLEGLLGQTAARDSWTLVTGSAI